MVRVQNVNEIADKLLAITTRLGALAGTHQRGIESVPNLKSIPFSSSHLDLLVGLLLNKYRFSTLVLLLYPVTLFYSRPLLARSASTISSHGRRKSYVPEVQLGHQQEVPSHCYQ